MQRNTRERKPTNSTKIEKQTKMTTSEAANKVPDMLASSHEEPGWVATLASIQASLACVQVNMEANQQSMNTKLDGMSKQMEGALKGVRDEVGKLREQVDRIGAETTQRLDGFRDEMNRKFEAVEVDMRDQRKDIGLVEERVGETEEWNTEAQDIVAVLLEQQTRLQEKLTDLEGRSRRNNIRIWGVKEGLEGDSVTKYIDGLIHEKLGLTDELQIQRAHRALAPKPSENKPARAIIVNFLRFDVKENILKTAWRTKVEVAGQRVTFDHDYSTEVAAKRRNYVGLKRILKEKGLRFQSPMTMLRVHWNDGPKVYNNPQEAARAMRQRGWEVPDQGEDSPTLRQRMETARKWTRVGRQERRDVLGPRATGDLSRFRRGAEGHGGD